MGLRGRASRRRALLEESPSVVVNSQMTPFFKIEARIGTVHWSLQHYSSVKEVAEPTRPGGGWGGNLEGAPPYAAGDLRRAAVQVRRYMEPDPAHTPPREQSSAEAAARYVIWVLSDSPTRLGVITRRQCPEENSCSCRQQQQQQH